MKKVSSFKRRFICTTFLTLMSLLFSPPYLDALNAATVTYSGPVNWTVTTYDSFNPYSVHNAYNPVTITINGRSYTYYTVTSKVPTDNTVNTSQKTTLENHASSQTAEVQVIAEGTKWATELYIIRSTNPGPTVMIVGGIHGNEAAGYKAAEEIKNWKINRGTLLVLPRANKQAIAINKRYVKSEGDLNRSFPVRSSSYGSGTLARAIYKTVQDYKVDWLMDMHEGYDFYKNSSTDSVGQTLIYYPNTATKNISKKIVKTINANISSSYRQFTLLRYPVRGSLARASAEFLGVNSFIFETSQKQDLTLRIDYHKKAAEILLKELGMK
ncbi:succinylglutamate desuccinylase/aspartoacylase family protein [Thermosyntropha sp.]|uniref:M99 family carboxypeptidase catalytic domain-containing protein n=1 Tax=Thermosyntropha sp. TaxID=2740820 RepID=UPI0025E5D831|nr:succinylglutamate desuccinylase/aspartoacylase family protein [Thermosyntropha sp.]MBO8158416.1 succinylglutamate desuccinylase/aspartoacylase family protein [Thermosyntropha sp.]